MALLKITPDQPNVRNPSNPLFDNTSHVRKTLYRFRSQGKLFVKALGKGASLKRLLITRFPYRFPDSKYAPSMHIEFTSACNLKCRYCNNPHFAHPRGMMTETTFNNLLSHIREARIDRICIGGGEATLHPKFNDYATALRKEARILTMVTNAHWKSERVAETLLRTIDYLEISVESGSKEDFEYVREGSDFDQVVRNLKELQRLKKELKSNTTINLRLMVRPSQKGAIERESAAFWRPYGDSLMPQYVVKIEGVDEFKDVFMSKQMAANEIPNCSLPFRNIQVRSSGEVPVCQVSGSALDPKKKLIAGNVNDQSLNDIWRGATFSKYRDGLRKKDAEKIPICVGCKGC